MSRLLPPLFAAAVLAGCASAPPPAPVTDESAQQVAEEWGNSFRMRWQLGYGDHTYELAGLYTGSPPQWSDRLVFIDGRFACASPGEITGVEWFWVSQPDGLAYLAGRLENACGHGDPVAPRQLRDAVAVVPAMPVTIAELPASQETSVADSVGTALLGSLVVGVGLILSPLAVGALPVIAASTSAIEAERARVSLAMPWTEAQAIVGEPSVSFRLPAAKTDVQSYLTTDTTLHTAGDWYVGVCDGRVIWIAGPDAWLGAIARQASSATK